MAVGDIKEDGQLWEGMEMLKRHPVVIVKSARVVRVDWTSDSLYGQLPVTSSDWHDLAYACLEIAERGEWSPQGKALAEVVVGGD
jgi:hypothetical protein